LEVETPGIFKKFWKWRRLVFSRISGSGDAWYFQEYLEMETPGISKNFWKWRRLVFSRISGNGNP
jgi:hypothetical protein